MIESSDKFSEKELESYYRKEPETTKKAILAFLRDSQNPEMIVFGSQALNAHLPPWLDKETKDWDVVASTSSKEGSEKLAHQLESKLDKRYGGDFFGVEPAIHEGTFRIRSKVTGTVVADVSLKDREIKFKRIQGINYASLEWLEWEAERLIASPDAEFRRAKDKDNLQRIKVYKRLKKRRQSGGGGGRYIDGSSVDTSMRGLR
jgi:hypothetical protein